jgi:hypothetical protein
LPELWTCTRTQKPLIPRRQGLPGLTKALPKSLFLFYKGDKYNEDIEILNT